MTAYNMSSFSPSLPIDNHTSSAYFIQDQAVKVQCSSNAIGSDPDTKFEWRMSNAFTGALESWSPSMLGLQDEGEAVESGICHHSRTAWAIYNITSPDLSRDSSNPLYFECYLYNPSLGSTVYETPVNQRPRFYVSVCKYSFWLEVLY